MLLFNKYISIQIVKVITILIILWIFIFSISGLYYFLNMSMLGRLPFTLVFNFIIYKSPIILNLSIFISVYIAVLIVISNAYSNNEISTIITCGLSYHRLCLISILPSIICSILLLYINGFLEPEFRHKQQQVLNSDTLKYELIHSLQTKSFIKLSNDITLYVKEKNNKQLKDIFIIYQQDNVEFLQSIFLYSNKGILKRLPRDKKALELYSGSEFLVDMEKDRVITSEFKRHLLNIGINNNVINKYKRLKSFNLIELWNNKSKKSFLLIQEKLFYSIAIIILSAIAVAISYSSPRDSQYKVVFLSVYIIFIYILLKVLFEEIYGNRFTQWYILISPHIIMLVFAIWLNINFPKNIIKFRSLFSLQFYINIFK